MNEEERIYYNDEWNAKDLKFPKVTKEIRNDEFYNKYCNKKIDDNRHTK
jgi:hypothetical protein